MTWTASDVDLARLCNDILAGKFTYPTEGGYNRVQFPEETRALAQAVLDKLKRVTQVDQDRVESADDGKGPATRTGTPTITGRFCRDCVHCLLDKITTYVSTPGGPGNTTTTHYLCHSPHLGRDLVTGEPRVRACKDERAFTQSVDGCGRDGKRWTPHPYRTTP